MPKFTFKPTYFIFSGVYFIFELYDFVIYIFTKWYWTAVLKSGPFLQSLALTLIKHTWAC